MECTLCKKEYVRKSETNFNIRLNSHRKDVKKPDAILAFRHVFNKLAKLIVRHKLKNTTKLKYILHQ